MHLWLAWRLIALSHFAVYGAVSCWYEWFIALPVHRNCDPVLAFLFIFCGFFPWGIRFPVPLTAAGLHCVRLAVPLALFLISYCHCIDGCSL